MNAVYTKPQGLVDIVRADPPAQKDLFQDLCSEPGRLYRATHLEQIQLPARFALCSKIGTERLHQDLFEVSRLDWVMHQIQAMPERHQKHFWISQATLLPGAQTRRINSIVLLNAIWVDVDLAHPPKGFDASKLPRGCKVGVPPENPESLAELVIMQLDDAGLPRPSYVIATGGGLCLKWLFETAIPTTARARWHSLQRQIMKEVGQLCNRWNEVDDDGNCHQQLSTWPVDYTVGDASRILRLVGTHNPNWGANCRIVWDGGKTYDFDYLATEILPYSRDEVHAFKAKFKLIKQWDKNRAKAAAAGIMVSKRGKKRSQASIDDLIEDEARRGIWNNRFEFGRAVILDRGRVDVGSRNSTWWPMANALAWSCGTGDQLVHELAALHQDHFGGTGWTRAEAMQAAGTVMRRHKEQRAADALGVDPGWDRGLYKFSNAKFCEKLLVTPDERAEFGHLLGGKEAPRAPVATGALGFEKMKNLAFPDYLTETRRRQAEAGRRSAEVRKVGPDMDKVEKARQMAGCGLSNRAIAFELGVSHPTIAQWLKSGW